LIERLSGDRIRHELNHILASNFAPQIISRLHELDLLSAVHPSLSWDEWLFARIEALQDLKPEPEWGLNLDGAALHQELGYTVWLMTLTPEDADGVVRRLKLPSQLARVIEFAGNLWAERHELAAASPSRVTAVLEDAPPLSVYALYLASGDARVRGMLRAYVTTWRKIEPHTDGHVLRRLGLAPGPRYRQIIRRLRSAWLDGEVKTDAEENALLEQLLREG
jgi:tRNA nucleotidyltransferase (CCA-adding enzyme)